MRLVDVPDERKRDIAALMERYVDQPMDVADATLVWLAEAASVYDIVNVDQADFSAYRTVSGKRLRNRFL
jgi:predicted nucleic acid-binding protein